MKRILFLTVLTSTIMIFSVTVGFIQIKFQHQLRQEYSKLCLHEEKIDSLKMEINILKKSGNVPKENFLSLEKSLTCEAISYCAAKKSISELHKEYNSFLQFPFVKYIIVEDKR
jgi:hypothetical protein